MKLDDRQIVRRLAWVMLIKLLALTLLWWHFVRPQRIEVDAEQMQTRVIGTASAPAPSAPAIAAGALRDQ